MNKKYSILFLVYSLCVYGMNHYSGRNVAPEDILELLYSRYLIDRAHRTLRPVSTQYKFIAYKKNMLLPTYYELFFKIQYHDNNTYTLHSVFKPVNMPAAQLDFILDELQHNRVPAQPYATTTFSYMADHLLKIIVAHTASIEYDLVNGQEQLQMHELEKNNPHHWFNISPCTMCHYVSDSLRPEFICKTLMSAARLQKLQHLIPQEKSISQYDLRAAADLGPAGDAPWHTE